MVPEYYSEEGAFIDIACFVGGTGELRIEGMEINFRERTVREKILFVIHYLDRDISLARFKNFELKGEASLLWFSEN